jgi:hypothetical protein
MLSSAAIIMTGPGRPDEPANLPYLRQVATIELARVLGEHGIQKVIVSGPDLDWWPDDVSVDLHPDEKNASFHFGSRLAQLIASLDEHPSMLFYFGGSSAPLLTLNILSDIQRRLASDTALVATNNVHSSDWIALNDIQRALPIIAGCARDNSLAWELRETASFEVHIASQDNSALHLDLDTPADFALVRHHPDCPPNLAKAINNEPDFQQIPVAAVLDVLRMEGSQVAIVGRVGPQPWLALNAVTRCWIRVFSEERGMVASGREARGEVRSVMGVLMDEIGPTAFFDQLAEMCDAVIMDSRLLMAHHGTLPPAPQRYRSDLLMWESLDEGWLRDFTQAAAQALVPILLGGHSAVAGGLWVMSQILSEER